jgi:hypothetical protein
MCASRPRKAGARGGGGAYVPVGVQAIGGCREPNAPAMILTEATGDVEDGYGGENGDHSSNNHAKGTVLVVASVKLVSHGNLDVGAWLGTCTIVVGSDRSSILAGKAQKPQLAL